MISSDISCVNGPLELVASASVVIDQAWTLPWKDLADFSIFGPSEGVIIGDDEWIVPKSFVNPNYYAENNRKINFANVLPEGWSRGEARSEHLVRRLKRIALLNMTQSVSGAKQRLEPPEPRTWVKHTNFLLRAARSAMELTDRVTTGDMTCPDPGPIFANLSAEAFDELRDIHPTFFQFCVHRLNGLFNAHLFDDWPAGDVKAIKPGVDHIRPFSDQAFTEILKAAHFFASIQKDLEACYTFISSIKCDQDGGRRSGNISKYRNQLIAQWTGDTLYPGRLFPLSIYMAGSSRRKKTGASREKKQFGSWPVDNPSGVKSLLWVCQSANAIILNTATGGRISEMMTLSREPLVRINGSENLTGYTFKESEDPKGTSRHWPLPALAVQAIERQQSLIETFDYQGDFLWIVGPKNTTGVAVLDNLVCEFGKKVQTLKGVPLGKIDGRITAHRFRYTTARLVGLAVEGASDVLYTVLGHTDLNTTMGYMLSDPDFRADADRVRREVQYVRRQRLIAEADDNGGHAAETLRIAKLEVSKKAASLDASLDDEGSLMAILPEIHKVRNDIYCTSQTAKQKGLCSEVTGKRDVGKCSPSCVFRLEAAAAEQDRRRTVEMAIKQLQSNVSFDGSRTFFQNQIVANLASFEKTLDNFVTDDRLCDALRGCDRRYIDRLPGRTRDKLIAYLDNSQ
ncbi:site-specific integrase [Cohaesibacter haloalkalitolerans]|uniref:site-specific integrase n=1 Tax=Cohaesibacter haloalkalitolerans TaxID=1162980 RepID=UPI000E65DC11|nr:site-specific integrase [Cohaesibacter haloalkalitolerans]